MPAGYGRFAPELDLIKQQEELESQPLLRCPCGRQSWRVRPGWSGRHICTHCRREIRWRCSRDRDVTFAAVCMLCEAPYPETGEHHCAGSAA